MAPVVFFLMGVCIAFIALVAPYAIQLYHVTQALGA